MVTDPAQKLLLEHLHPRVNDHILILEGGVGRLAQAAAHLVPDGEILTLARDVRDIWAAKHNLSNLPNAITGFNVIPSSNGWDIVLLEIPKERRYARKLLITAWDILKPGGRLLLAGPTRKGAKAVIKDANRLFGDAAVLGYRGHQRVATCTRRESSPRPLPEEFQQTGIAPGTTHTIEYKGLQGSLSLSTHPGIFSWDGVDDGTALLLDHLDVIPGSRIWDVGCGYGIIGLTAALSGAAFVAMSDVNLLGVDYAKQNADQNRLSERVCIFPADGLAYHPESTPDSNLPSALPFDLIVSNPAFHQGHLVDKSMADQLITRAPHFLAPKGRLVFVANRFLNYEIHMQPYFKRITRLAETKKFHVLMATNS